MELSKSKQVGRFGKRSKKASFKESDLQKACEEILNTYGIPFIRIPDEVYNMVWNASESHISKGTKIKVFDYIAGVPDLIVLFPGSQKFHCFELKSDSGKLRVKQKSFRNKVDELNYTVIRDAQTFANIVHEMRK